MFDYDHQIKKQYSWNLVDRETGDTVGQLYDHVCLEDAEDAAYKQFGPGNYDVLRRMTVPYQASLGDIPLHGAAFSFLREY